MLDAWIRGKFFFWSTSELKEVCSKPNLLDVGLMARFCDDLLDCILLLAFFVLSKPYQAEPSSTQQFYLVKTIRKAISEGLALLFT